MFWTSVCEFRHRCSVMGTHNLTIAVNSFQAVIIFALGVVVSLCISYLTRNFDWNWSIEIETAGSFSSDPTVKNVNTNLPLPTGTSLAMPHRKTVPVVSPDVEAEAMASLNLALEMESHGKHNKAMKLYQHALALDPVHADILNKYGEFLEHHHNDIIMAEHMYSKALTVRPDHTSALSNKKRALPVVEELDQNTFNRIDQKRDRLFQLPEHHPAFKRAIKESYYHHIYHTVAIEGNTMTLSQARSVVETQMAIAGKSIIEHNEILGVDSAMSYINKTLIHRIGRITLSDILEIHRRVLGFCDPVEAGKLRTKQVFVGNYMPPGPAVVEQLMEEFITWLNSDEALSLHPIEYAALAHYKLVFVHPFYDGNGRTSRLLMNLILMQAGYVPVIIRVEEKHKYYQHLETANDGDVRPFIRFIAECTERMLDHFLIATSDNPHTIKELPRRAYSEESRRTIHMDNDP